MQELPDYAKKAKERVDVFKASLLEESDRGVVLIGAAFIEDELEVSLRAYFSFVRDTQTLVTKDLRKNAIEKATNELFEAYKPLSTFSAKSDFVFSFGLLPEREYRCINVLRKIRNKFAHQIESSNFTSPKVKDLLKEFVGTKVADRNGIVDRMTKLGNLSLTRSIILNDENLDMDLKKTLIAGFAINNPYGL